MPKKQTIDTLVIVESPTKAKTIGRFLGKKYTVESSYGHVRDLPKSKLGVDVEEGSFLPQYVIPTKVRKRVTALKKLAEKAETVILATDEDREGEAIAWHLTHALGLGISKSESLNPKQSQNTKPKIQNVQRIVFHEITKGAIADALENPRDIDERLVDAQQARRVLDRIVGYKLSPFLWKKVFRGLSAGRVQSVALRLIADREDERKAFRPQEYWSIDATLKNGQEFEASLCSIEDKQVGKMDIGKEVDAKVIKKDLEKATCAVARVEQKERKRNPLPPFTTSTLQQEASRRLHMSARQTMSLAQSLYENGHITYMRTDSVNLSSESLQAAKEWISGELGRKYVLDAPRVFRGKSKMAQEAHEAIRPTRPDLVPEKLKGQTKLSGKDVKLYDLIWRRFIASQLPPAQFDATTIDTKASATKTYMLRSTGSVLRFDGFLKIWPSKVSENELPDVSEGDDLELKEVRAEQHFTEPPPRYTEASLVKALEENGIGRPSTYAPTISVIQTRNYIEKDDNRRFLPTETGTIVNNLLKEHFPKIVDIGFTAEMEGNLDNIAEGKEDWVKLIRTFYGPFDKHLEEKYEEVAKMTPEVTETTDEKCEKCGKDMMVKIGRFGKFLACTGFPDCKTTKSFVTEKDSFGDCPDCTDGKITRKRTKKGRFFYGCSNYPDCEHASWKKPGSEDAASDKDAK